MPDSSTTVVMSQADGSAWSFDRKISPTVIMAFVAALATVVAQVVGGAWLVSSMSTGLSARVDNLERSDVRLEQRLTERTKELGDKADERWTRNTGRLDALERDRVSTTDRLTRMEERMDNVLGLLKDIKDRIGSRR